MLATHATIGIRTGAHPIIGEAASDNVSEPVKNISYLKIH